MSILITKLTPREHASVLSALQLWIAAGRPLHSEYFEDIPEGALDEADACSLFERLQTDVNLEVLVDVTGGIVNRVFVPCESDHLQIHIFDADIQDDPISLTLQGLPTLGVLYSAEKIVDPGLINDVSDTIDAIATSDVAGTASSGDDTDISEDTFHEQWGAHAKPSGDLYDFEELKSMNVADNLVWTIVEGEDESWFAVAGYRIVNKIGYVLTSKPWETGLEQALWFLADLEHADGNDDSEDVETTSFTAASAQDLFANV